MNASLVLDRAPANAGFDALLTPLDHGDGVGTSLRNDPVYQQIRDRGVRTIPRCRCASGNVR